ncbi:MAG: hypothetical protein ACI4QT_01205, partial [Kiritimatiellia bacterium]
MAAINTRKESLHDPKYSKTAVERTSKRLVDEVYGSPRQGKRRAVEAIFDSIVRVCSPLVKDIALSVPNDATSRIFLFTMSVFYRNSTGGCRAFFSLNRFLHHKKPI